MGVLVRRLAHDHGLQEHCECLETSMQEAESMLNDPCQCQGGGRRDRVEISQTLGNSSAGWSNSQSRPSQGARQGSQRCKHACTELYLLCSMRVEGVGITTTKVTALSQSREHCSTHRCS